MPTGGIPTGYGNANKTGHYDGMIGLVQRNEADMSLWNVALDDLPFDPAYVGVPTYVKDGQIMTIRRSDEESKIDLLDAFSNFDIQTWSFYFICVSMVLAVLVSFWVVSDRSIFSKLRPQAVYRHL